MTPVTNTSEKDAVAGGEGISSAASPPSVASDAVFPRDLPYDGEKFLISIIYEEDRLRWNLHDAENKYVPTLFWITSHVEKGDRSLPSCLALSRFLCNQAKTLIFGDSNAKSAKKEVAHHVAKKRKIPAITVYVAAPLSSLSPSSKNPALVELESNVTYLFQDVPVRILKLSTTDFFTAEQTSLVGSTVSVGQCAAMYACKIDYDSSPVLLMNVGIAATQYIVMDGGANLIGIGACCSIAPRLRMLFDYCGSASGFPSIGGNEYNAMIDKVKAEGKPMSIFSSSADEAVVATAVSEFSGQLRNIVKQFIKMVTNDKVCSSNRDNAQRPKVVLTGDASQTAIVSELLKEHSSNLLVLEPGVKSIHDVEVELQASSPSSIIVGEMISIRKNMASYGIQHLLNKNKKVSAPRHPDDILREDIVGLRVAISTSEKETDVQRGSIVRVIPGKIFEEDTFVATIDGGDDICLDLCKLYDSMYLYLEVGELSRAQDKENWVEDKKRASEKVQIELVEKNDQIKKRKSELQVAKSQGSSVVQMLSPAKQKRGEKRQRSPQSKAAIVEEDPTKYIGRRIAKYFDVGSEDNPLFFGTIDKVTESDPKNPFWHISYDDGDEEEFDFRELRQGILLWSREKEKDSLG